MAIDRPFLNTKNQGWYMLFLCFCLFCLFFWRDRRSHWSRVIQAYIECKTRNGAKTFPPGWGNSFSPMTRIYFFFGFCFGFILFWIGLAYSKQKQKKSNVRHGTKTFSPPGGRQFYFHDVHLIFLFLFWIGNSYSKPRKTKQNKSNVRHGAKTFSPR